MVLTANQIVKIGGFAATLLRYMLSAVLLSACATGPSNLVMTPPAVLPEGNPPRNLILVTVGGMGLGQLTASMYASGNYTQLERCRVSGLHHNSSQLTEPNLAAMAICAGIKAYPGAIGVDRDSLAVRSIMEIAREKGKSTGIITTGSFFDAIPACMFAHVKKPAYYNLMPCQLADSGLTVGLGGGNRLFEAGFSDCQQRNDNGGVLLRELSTAGQWHDSLLTTGKRTLIFTGQHWPPAATEGRTFLPDASERFVKYLDAEAAENGYFLVIDVAQSAHAARNHDYPGLLQELQDLERTLKLVLDAAAEDGNTLVVITAVQEMGGFSIQIGSRQDSIAPHFASRDATTIMVPVFAYGPWAEVFSGIYPATAVFEKLFSCIR